MNAAEAKNTITIDCPDACIKCIFNYDGLDCRIFKDRYDDDFGQFDEYLERPTWCNWTSVEINLKEQK